MVPRKQAGHMTCTRPQAERQILLAMRASSTHDPKATFWHLPVAPTKKRLVSGRDALEGVAHCYWKEENVEPR
jgi:hypothetical protein